MPQGAEPLLPALRRTGPRCSKSCRSQQLPTRRTWRPRRSSWRTWTSAPSSRLCRSSNEAPCRTAGAFLALVCGLMSIDHCEMKSRAVHNCGTLPLRALIYGRQVRQLAQRRRCGVRSAGLLRGDAQERQASALRVHRVRRHDLLGGEQHGVALLSSSRVPRAWRSS